MGFVYSDLEDMCSVLSYSVLSQHLLPGYQSVSRGCEEHQHTQHRHTHMVPGEVNDPLYMAVGCHTHRRVIYVSWVSCDCALC